MSFSVAKARNSADTYEFRARENIGVRSRVAQTDFEGGAEP
jgi:hypothetical protein